MDIRETRLAAREIKFVVDGAMRADIVAWARANLACDGYGAGQHADEYTTSTLYFETPAFDVYRRRGSYGRSKYRVRRYGDSTQVFFERKFRTTRLLSKRRTPLPIEDLEKLDHHEASPDWEGIWFHRRVRLRRLKPMIQLSYDRVARVGTSATGPVRLTIDTNLAALPMPDRSFLPAGVGLPFLEGRCIVEVKYRVSLPVLFRQLAETFGLEIQKVSKFRSGLRALDYPLPRDPDEEVPSALDGPDADVEHDYQD